MSGEWKACETESRFARMPRPANDSAIASTTDTAPESTTDAGPLTAATETDEWDAPVTRVEAGTGYYIQRNLTVKTSLQFNRRDGGRVTSSQLFAMQLLYWF